MGVLYPDNGHRVQRVNDLGNNIAIYQDEIKSKYDHQELADQRMNAKLAQVAKASGHKTVQEYIEASLAMLPDTEKAAIKKLRDDISKHGANADKIKFTVEVLLAVGPLGMALTSSKFLAKLPAIASYMSGFRALGLSVSRSVSGVATEAGEAVEMVELSFESLETLDAGAEAAATASKLLTFGRFASRAVAIAGILLLIGGLIYDGVEGKKQMDECKKYTLELSSKRYAVKKMLLDVETAYTFMDEIRALIDLQMSLQSLVDQGLMTPAIRDAAVKAKMDQLAEDYAKLPTTSDKEIMEDLHKLDINASSWLGEEYTFEEMQKYLAELHKKDEEAKKHNNGLR